MEVVSGIRSRLNAFLLQFFKMEKCFVFEKTLPDPRFKAKVKVGVDVRLVQSDDISIVSRTFENFQMDAQERFKKGCVCFGAILNGKFVHLKWFAFDEWSVIEIDRKIRISSDSVYLFGSYTVLDYRGLGIAPKVMEKAFQFLSRIGTKRIYSVQRQNNFPDLRVRQKEGWRKMGAVTYIRVFKFRFYRLRGETERDYDKLREMFSV